MNISLEWIAEYTDIKNLDPERIAHELTMSCAEVEELHQLHRWLKGVVVGEIVDIERMPNSEDLSRAVVDCGDATFTTVCGAPNAKIGIKSAFAKVGARLSAEEGVSLVRVGNVTSQGILCSAKELGFGEFHDGILILPRTMKNGAPLADTVPQDDTIIEFDNKSLSHRPDLWGHYGIAREIAAIMNRDLIPLPLADVSKYDDLPSYPMEIDDTENCRCYGCIEIESIEIKASPLFVQWRLYAIGQKPINVLVDLTNYIMLELGQPMHAFNGNKVGSIRVAPAGATGKFLTLDGIERELLSEDLLIWGDDEPIALAGIMGGLDSEIDEGTHKLLLESANFKGSRIRRTASRLGLRTEASQRFEKNQPPVNTRESLARFLHLSEVCDSHNQVSSRLTLKGSLDEERDAIVMPMQFLEDKIGMRIGEERVLEILSSLGFRSSIVDSAFSVTTPPFRSREDISIAEDIVEEVARIYGYDNISPELPKSSLQPVVPNAAIQAEHRIRRLLALSHGFHEIHTYAWFDDRWIRSIGFDPLNHLTVRNPSSEHSSRLRTILIPNLLQAVHQNIHNKDSFRLFEIGRVYEQNPDGETAECSHLGGVCYKHSKQISLQHHYSAIEAVVEDIFNIIYGVSPRIRRGDKNSYPWQAKGTYADIVVGKANAGRIGILPPKKSDSLLSGAQVIWFECDLSVVEAPRYPNMKYREVSAFQGSSQDFSIVWEQRRGFSELERIVNRFENTLVRKSDFIGLYQGKGLPIGHGSYTFRYWIGHEDRTLERVEIEDFIGAFSEFLCQEGLALRS